MGRLRPPGRQSLDKAKGEAGKRFIADADEKRKEYRKPPKTPLQKGEIIYKGNAQDRAVRRGVYKKNTIETLRDIWFVPEWSYHKPVNFREINWERRLACKADPVLDLKTYMPAVFYLDWADFHIELINEIDYRIKAGGKKAVAFPRASGKTAICRGMIIRAMKYGLRQFPFFIGSKENKAVQTLEAIKTFWYRSPLLIQDFPEVAYPVTRIEGRGQAGAQGQLYKDHRTHLLWSNVEIQTPCMMLTEEDAKGYLENDPSCITYLPEHDRFLINSAGILLRVAGIDGSIRGEADIHPILLKQPRPDLILLDDIQKDQAANSPKTCEDICNLIETAVTHLSAPDVVQACLMPCTVIREGDVSDTYLNPDLKPTWNGKRLGLIRSFPPGIDYDNIYEEINGVPNQQGILWNEYKEIRDRSYREHGNLKLANEFYRENQEVMDRGIEVTWRDRFLKNSPDPDMNEVSAIQSVFNWRFTDHNAYLSEGENRPSSRQTSNSIVVTAEEVKEKYTNIPRGHVSTQWTNVVAFVDIQDELFYYAVFAHDSDFNGQFIEYGSYPELRMRMWRKNQLGGWACLSRDFYKHHKEDPNTPSGFSKGKNLRTQRAPFDAKIYHGLRQTIGGLLNREYPVLDGASTKKIRALAIDTRWGDAANTVKQFVREFNDQRVMCFEGAPFQPSYKQLEQWNAVSGWLFEHQQFPHIAESRWVIKPYNKSVYQQRYILADVNRWKSFLMKRWATPMGSPGCITLHHVPSSDYHAMFAMHTAAEHPEEIIANGYKKDCWQEKPGLHGENDFLDCQVGCLCLASICGASLKHDDKGKNLGKPRVKSLRELYNKQRERAAAEKPLDSGEQLRPKNSFDIPAR